MNYDPNESVEEEEIKGRIAVKGPRKTALQEVLEVIIEENKYDKEKLVKEKRDDRGNFTLYLNYAVANIQEVTGVAGSDLRRSLNALNEQQVGKLADFLWTFRFDEPGFDFRKMEGRPDHDYHRLAPKLAQKIVSLRDYFVHDDRSGNEPLICDHDLYILVEGLLRPKAEENAAGPHTRIDKLSKGHFLNLREKCERREDRKYDLTRKGIMFLTCLALYKDDAEEFLSGFKDMRIPNRRRDALENLTPEEAKELFGGPKAPSKRAFLDAFTYFSYRRGRVSVNTEDNADYLNFANIIGYLCKVPKASFNYLELGEERKLLAELSANSTESEENKLHKYDLAKQIREKERFVSLAAGWLEDRFRNEHQPLCIHFKRLDITPTVGRHRYLFGAENDNAVRMDRHYVVEDGAIRFEWRAKGHYRPDGIKIGSLRSALSAQEFRHLLFCVLRDPLGVNAALDDYFTSYHRLLEIMLNSEVADLNVYANPDLAAILRKVTGKTVDELVDEDENLTLSKFFPRNVWRYFCQFDNAPSEDDKKRQLLGDATHRGAVGVEIARCEDFLTRVGKFRDWLQKNAGQKPENRERMPRCAKGTLLHPPRECRISDVSSVARVMAYLNFFLAPNRKFRQLQIGEQHNAGLRDHEYQMVRHVLEKFSYDNDGVLCRWNTVNRQNRNGRDNIKWGPAKRKLDAGDARYRSAGRDSIESWNDGLIYKLRPELREPLEALNRALKGSRDIKPFRGNYDLRDLAAVAADLLKRKLEGISREAISEALCRKFKVRMGLPLDHEALVRIILGIDMKRWLNAFDYTQGRKYSARRLEDGEHVVSQVPFPNGFADRHVLNNERMFGDVIERARESVVAKVAWPRAFAALDDSRMRLLGYYDVSPLVNYIWAHRTHEDVRKNENPDPAEKGINFWPNLDAKAYPPDFSRSGINKAIAAIKTVHNEDRLLLRFAEWYWERYQRCDSFDPANAQIARVMAGGEVPTVRKFYEVKRPIQMAGVNVTVSRNDVFSPTFAHVRENAAVIVRLLKQEEPGRVEFSFAELSQFYARRQRDGRSLRKEFIPLVCAFVEKCPIPASAYSDSKGKALKGADIREMEYNRYAKVFTWMSREDYDRVADMRNRIMHDNLLIVDDDGIVQAKKILRRAETDFTPLPKPKPTMSFTISIN